MAQVISYTGTAHSPRTQAIHRHLVDAPDSTRLIVPTQRAVQQRTRQILRDHPETKGFLGRPIMTFQDFAAGLLEGTVDSFPLVSPTTQQLLLKRSIQLAQDAGLLGFLGEATERPGFVHHVQRLIAQLKQDAILPLDFRETIAKRKHPTAFDAAVAEIYTNYQNLLLSSATFDLQGMYWLADLACQGEKPAAFKSVNTLLIDGFDDFTPSEFRLIQSLEGHLDTLIFGLNYDTAPHRRDAYALVRATHEHIQQSFITRVEDFEGQSPAPKTSCQQVARTLFWGDSSELRTIPASLQPNLSLVPCHTITHEIETLARTIKRQVLQENVPLSDILIVFKQPETYAHTVTQVFEEAGIPLRPVQTTTLAQSSFADFLLKLYESTAQWDREAIVHVLTSPHFQSLAQSLPEHVECYRHLAYRAEILEGYLQWDTRLNHFSERLLKRNERQVDTWLHHMPQLHEACLSLIHDVERLKNLTESIAASTSFSAHIETLQTLRDVFSRDAIVEAQLPSAREREFHAWDALTALLRDLDPVAQTMELSMSRSECVGQLRELFALSPLPESSVPGGVLCLRLDDARHVQMPYVYVCGANEGVIPAPPPVNAIYSQFDQKDLAQVGMRMVSPREHAEKERLQFLRLFSIPTQHLSISWHESTQQGQVLYPSPFVQDVRDLQEHIPIIVQREAVSSPMNTREAVNASVEEKQSLLPALSATVEDALTKVRVEKSRYAASAFNEFDGVLSVPTVIERVAGHYNTQHPFSANQIETYIDCPFRFMMRTMLHLSERETPALSFDRRIMGIIYHNALEEFYAHYTGQLLEETSLDEALETMTRVATEAFTQTVGAFAQAYPGIAQVERTRILQKLTHHVESHHGEGSNGWKPSHAEVTFGEALNSGSDPLSKPDYFSLRLDDQDYLFAGRIDRVDRNDQNEARIVDYKTSLGSIAEKDIKEGRNIQLSLYAMALEKVLMPDVQCSETIYLKIGNDETKGNPKKGTEGVREAAQEAIATAIHSIQAGVFHPKAHTKSCNYCPKNKVCRFEEGRIAGKTTR